MRQEQLKDCNNRIVSTCHAVILFFLTSNYWLTKSNIFEPPPSELTDYPCFCIDIMLGYLVYDLLNEVITAPKLDIGIVAHHITGMLSLGSIRALGRPDGAHYNMIIFIAEASTPFLHISYYMHCAKLEKNVYFTLCCILLVALFFLCRVILGPFLFYKMYTERSVWGDSEFDLLLFWSNFVIVGFFVVLNFYWFRKLLKVAMS